MNFDRTHWSALFITSALFVVASRPALAAASESGLFTADGETACAHGKLECFAASDDAADKDFDEKSGRNLRHYPPDRPVDMIHMKLQMRFEDLNEPRFTATETLQFEPLGDPLATLTLDAVDLHMQEVRLDGAPIEFFYDGESLTLYFDPPLVAGSKHELVVDYLCESPYAGMFFTPSSPDAPGYTAEVHTQGQTESNRHWFIARDFPNERMTSELIVNVPSGYSVSSNGRKIAHLVSGDRTTWHWLQDKPHVSYLVSLVIGKFDIVELTHSRVPLKVWVPEGMGDRVQRTYGRTGAMIDCFERRYGVPYPWDRYDQLVVKNFGAGGMENTSATTLYPSAILDERALLDGDLDSLIAHELAHQWTGDLITCKSWEHIWLNEGWATFGSALWFEERDGEDGYLDSIRRQFDVAKRDRTSDPLPMVSPVYENAWETFRRRANPYPKGASILHMLRRMLGEEVFWSGVRLYMSRFAGKVVETSDFRYAMEEASGRGLEWFFEQWCERPGCPNLEVDVRFDAASRQLVVEVEQTQQVDARTPAFRFTLPVHVITASGAEHVFPIEVTERTTSFQTPLGEVPRIIAVDPELHVLKTIEVTKPLPMWIAQAAGGPTIAARHAAIEALAKSDTPETVTLLSSIVRDEDIRYTLRQTAVGSLRKLGSESAKAELLSLVEAGAEDARVRATLMTAAGDLDRELVVDLLARTADRDPSYATQVEAIRSLARLEAKEEADLIANLVHVQSQHDQVRNAALEALAELDDARGLALGMQYAAYGYNDRSRAVAVKTVGRLSSHDPEATVRLLTALLDDPERRPREAAAEGLARTKSKDALAPLQAIASANPDPDFRRKAEKLVTELEASLAEAGTESTKEE